MSVPAISPADALHETGQKVIDRIGIPKDRWEIAAQLEVLGFRDGDARARFGCSDLFETADRILAMFAGGSLVFHAPPEDPERRRNTVLRFVIHYLEGLTSSFPMVLQGATMLLLGYGLWGALDLDLRIGSAIALGYIASYVTTSGFAWATVRRGLFYYYQDEGALARWSALRMWWISVRVALAIAAAATLFNLLYGFFPWRIFGVALAYYAALALFWLNWSLMYLVRKTTWLLIVLTIAIGVVVVAARVLGWPIVAANMLGLAVADSLTFAIALLELNRWARNGSGNPMVNPPRFTVLIYSSGTVFLYGFLFSAFLFVDRLLAWTSVRGREDFPPYPFWLSARYELGMDLALIVVVLVAGVLEYSTHQFSARIVPGEKRVRSPELGPFLDDFRAFHRRHTAAVVICAAAALAIGAMVVQLLQRLPYERLREMAATPTTMRVFWVAAVSYAIFAVAMQRILILMTLSRADVAARAMAAAFLANAGVGFAVSRSIHYSGAVFGLLAGSIVLAVLAQRYVSRTLGELDYYYYAAY